jgi:hypothetical protein
MHTPTYLAIRKHWQALLATRWGRGEPMHCEADRCLLPGLPIQHGGTRTPAHLDVGHRVPIVLDPRRTWTIDDTRPEHARCNRSAGVNLGRKLASLRKAQTPPTPLEINKNDF